MAFKSICILLILLTCILNAVQPESSDSRLPWNPLYALDWENLNLFDQIKDDFIINNKVEFRSHSGVGNNIINPFYGSTNSYVPRCLPAVYGDGFNSMTGATRMNPREISNVLSRQLPENDPIFVNNRDLTQFAWQWGQFIDHDITLISEDKSALDLDDDIDIYVPCGDPEFDPLDECDANNLMEVFRTKSNNTGTNINNTRQQINEITSFIDASMIYGSDNERANELRTFQDGKMKMSDDIPDNLPKNKNRLPNEPNDDSRFFLGGDVRVNEQLGLLTMHTIWVRAHNIISDYVSDSIKNKYRNKNSKDFDETVYQYTKLIINAIIQKIVYKDWLPTLFGPTAIQMFLGNYNGYNNNINPGICPIFASAAYRLGHTFLPQILPLRNQNCAIWNPKDLKNNCPNCINGGIELKNAFFVPEIVENTDGFYDALLNGYACTKANEVDTFVTEGVRNFLFFSSVDKNNNNQRLFGDLDLVAINLQRGREHGLPDYNNVRQQLGLNKLINFNEITSNIDLANQFYIMYKENINDIDLFLGGLAEDHFEDGSFGETISAIVLGQFKRLRDGDRFFYQNYIKPGELLDFINCMTLKSIIELTTDIKNIDAIDSIRHNMFQNKRAISIFDDTDTFKAKQIPISNINDNNYNKPNDETETFVIQLTNLQVFMLLCVIIITIGCFCYSFHKCKQNKNKKYFPVKYDTDTDTDGYDKEKLQI